jgi:chaperonin GroES
LPHFVRFISALEAQYPNNILFLFSVEHNISWHSYQSSAKNAIYAFQPPYAPAAERTPMKFRPLQDRVVIRRAESDLKSKGGIIIPDTAKEKPQEGDVIAVGAGTRNEGGTLIPLDVKAGDTILFGKWSGTEVSIDGEALLIMKEADIMGIVGKTDAASQKIA